MAAASSSYAGVPSSIGRASGAAAPLAIAKHVSLVDVSESTVTLLNDWLTAESSASWSALGATGASVVTTAIMVAMFGMIMPEPLHMPPTVNVAPS